MNPNFSSNSETNYDDPSHQVPYKNLTNITIGAGTYAVDWAQFCEEGMNLLKNWSNARVIHDTAFTGDVQVGRNWDTETNAMRAYNKHAVDCGKCGSATFYAPQNERQA